MSVWRLRLKVQPDLISEWPAEALLQMLRSGVAGEQHEFLPPDETTWLSAFETLRRLEASDATSLAVRNETGERGVVSPPVHSTQERVADAAPLAKDSPSQPATNPAATKAAKRLRAVASTKSAEVVRPESPTASRPPRERRQMPSDLDDEDELEMTPMIDLTFLLLIFFMVTSSVTSMAHLQLPESHTGRAEKTEERVVLIVDFPEALSKEESQSLNGSKFIVLANARLSFQDDIERVFTADQLEAELQRKFTGSKASQFVLMANRKMPVGVVRQVLKAAAAAGAQETLVGVTMPR